MAAVYLAIQESLGRPVALKILYPGYANSPEFAERFLDEGRIIAALNHTNISTIHDIGIAGESPYISMEYVEGGDLRNRIAEGMTPAAALDLVQIIGGCLSYAHRVNIVHRDVKPANILFRPDGTSLLTDFGIAKQLQEGHDRTATGALLGSPHYLSPEQARGHLVDGRADIYSLGIVFYEMLTGEKPYCGDSDVSTIFQHLQHPIPHLSAPLARCQVLIDRMLAKDPVDRFSDAGAMLQFISAFRLAEAEGPSLARVPDSDPVSRFVSAEQASRRRLSGPHRFMRVSTWRAAAVGLVMGLTLVMPQPIGSDRPSERVFLQPPKHAVKTVKAAVTKPEVSVEKVASKKAGPKPRVKKRARAASKTASKGKKARSAKRSKANRSAAANRLLKLGDRALADYRLTTPSGDSAYHYYRKALKVDPGNARAKSGLRKIADRYAWLAEGRIAKYQYDKAQHYVALGLAVQPDNERLLLLRDKARARNAPKQMLEGVRALFRNVEAKLGGGS